MRSSPRTSILALTALALSVVCCLGAAAAPAFATDKKPVAKPKPKPPTGIDVFIHIDGVDGESKDDTHKGDIEILHVLDGRLHVVVQTSYDADGNVAERRLHANLMDAFATSFDGTVRVPATGSESVVRPGEACSESECPPETWSLQFDVPHGSFTLRLATEYDADGTLTGATILRGDGPPILQ